MAEIGRTRDTEFIELRELLERASGDSIPDDALDRARERAIAAREDQGPSERAQAAALLGFAADLLVSIVLERGMEAARLGPVIDDIERMGTLPRLALAREVMEEPELLRLTTPKALELLLGFLLAFSGLRTITLWSLGPAATVAHLGHAGDFEAPIGPPRALARQLLESGAPELREDPDLHGVSLGPYGRSGAGVIGEGKQPGSAPLTALVGAAAPTLVTLLELSDRRSAAGPDAAATASAERRLRRLRFDLHDGPQQDVILLAEDLRLFRAQLGSVTQNHPSNYRLLTSLDDLQARLVALAGDLRRISNSVESPTLQTGSLPDAVAQAADDFTSRTGIDPEIQMRGDFTPLTDSQQITMLALVREALNNIREHSDAKHVTVSLVAGEAGAEVVITDDGRGFEPEEELVRAARGGHLGLVGMHERVRMLGGLTSIDSRPGGPTTISARIPPWLQGQPAGDTAAPEASHDAADSDGQRQASASEMPTGAPPSPAGDRP
jgi:signal transduction histidine kinase